MKSTLLVLLLVSAGRLHAGETGQGTVSPAESLSPTDQSGVDSLGLSTPAADEYSPSTRTKVILGKFPELEVLRELSDLLSQSSASDIAEELLTVGQLRYRPARRLLASYLTNKDAIVVRSALNALALTGSGTREVCESVYVHLNDADELIQVAALSCVTAWNNRRVMPFIIPKLASASERVANESANALKSLSGVDFARNGAAWSAWYEAHQRAINLRLEELATKLHSPDRSEVITTIDRLTAFQDNHSEIAELIAPLQYDADLKVAVAAMQAMLVVKSDEVDVERMHALLTQTSKTPVESTAPVAASALKSAFLDSWTGLLAVAFGGIAALASTLFILRTAPVRAATKRYLKPIAQKIAKQTARFVNPVLKPITSRIKRMAEPITLRMKKSITDRFKKSFSDTQNKSVFRERPLDSLGKKTISPQRGGERVDFP